jgi:hypothetical protein
MSRKYRSNTLLIVVLPSRSIIMPQNVPNTMSNPNGSTIRSMVDAGNGMEFG